MGVPASSLRANTPGSVRVPEEGMRKGELGRARRSACKGTEARGLGPHAKQLAGSNPKKDALWGGPRGHAVLLSLR